MLIMMQHKVKPAAFNTVCFRIFSSSIRLYFLIKEIALLEASNSIGTVNGE